MIRATATRTGNYTHRVEIGDHKLTVDEPARDGGDDEGPSPQELLAASLAACTAITIEMYAGRKGWDVGEITVDCEYEQAERGSPTEIRVIVRLPETLGEEQRDRLNQIGAKCPVHRTLEGEVTITQLVEPTARS